MRNTHGVVIGQRQILLSKKNVFPKPLSFIVLPLKLIFELDHRFLYRK